MKRIIFYLLLLAPMLGSAQFTIFDGIGPCTFPWMEGQTTESRPYFEMGVHKRFGTARIYLDLQQNGTTPTYAEIDRSVDPPGIGPIAWDHPWHATGWRLDSTYGELKASGVDALLCLQGAFSNQDIAPGASKRKHPAIDRQADPNSVDSYWPFAQLYAQQVLRYGPNRQDSLIAPLRVVPGNSFLTEVRKSGLNIAWAFQAGNEDNFPWNGGVVLTAYQSGIKWALCHTLARQASPDAELVMPSFLGATFVYLKEFIAGYEEGCRQIGISPTYDWWAAFHRYHRVGGMGQTQGADTGASPESVQAHLLFEGMVEVAERYGLKGVLCTETGWNDDPRPEGIKQVAPLQEGFTLSESVALMQIRNTLIAQASGVARVYYYQIRDEYEGQPYTYTGYTFHRSHPSYSGFSSYDPKPVATFLWDWLDRYGDYTVVRGSYKVQGAVHSVAVTLAGADVGELRWTDGAPYQGVTPEPRLFFTDTIITEPEPVPTQIFYGDTVRVEKVGRKLYRVVKQ